MDSVIRFPYLGLEVSPGKSVEIFGITIAYYGIIIAVGVIVGALIAFREAKRTRQNVDDYIDFAIWTLFMALIGARLYYCIFKWDYYGSHPLEIITGVRSGGLAIYGGVIASVITLIVFTKLKKLNFWQMADTACLGLIIGQAIGRWGNFFNREAFGSYTNNVFAMQLPKGVALSHADSVETLLQNLVYVDGEPFVQVHPTFLYESLWCIGVFILLMLFRKHKKFHGEVFAMYVAGYGLGRTWIEGLRTDQLLIGTVPVSQLLSAVAVCVAVGFVVYKLIKIRKNPQLALVNEGILAEKELSGAERSFADKQLAKAGTDGKAAGGKKERVKKGNRQ